MDIDEVGELAASLEGVRRTVVEGHAQWRYRGRVVARQLDGSRLVIRCTFDARDALLRAFPETFSVPPRYRAHMMVVADLTSGDPGAVEDALEGAWLLQRRHFD
ncbi:MAG TPA: hypothetical protein VND62_00160 [Acidimicrobiales bacterium]|nr:hypothetical protein [Acidimicrobiales bacterium]